MNGTSLFKHSLFHHIGWIHLLKYVVSVASFITVVGYTYFTLCIEMIVQHSNTYTFRTTRVIPMDKRMPLHNGFISLLYKTSLY